MANWDDKRSDFNRTTGSTGTGVLDPEHHDVNPDPLTGAPGAHPVGTGVGAVSGGAAGVAVGTAVGGPVGAVVGGAIGAVVGGLAGKGIAESIDPTVEDTYWRENYASRNYVDRNRSYDDYQPAYRYGWESRGQNVNRSWDEVENDLERGWEHAKGRTNMAWADAKHATKDAWHRVEHALPGDADGDGR